MPASQSGDLQDQQLCPQDLIKPGLRHKEKLCHTHIIQQLCGVVRMSLQAHLAELERKHQALEKEIEAERLHPGSDDLKLVELKRKKLILKDEIEKLRKETKAPTKH
jgi:hypothetical protein